MESIRSKSGLQVAARIRSTIVNAVPLLLILSNIGATSCMDMSPKVLSRSLSATAQRNIGRKVIAAARKPTTGSYERMCLLSLFTKSDEFDNEERFSRLHDEFRDAPTQRELVLALGRAAAEHWFITRRRDYHALEPWTRRAFLAAFSCVNHDARGPFYRSLRNGADILERSIISWASNHPFA